MQQFLSDAAAAVSSSLNFTVFLLFGAGAVLGAAITLVVFKLF
jgi:hypothetical protein